MDKKRFAVIIAGLSANFGGGATDVLVDLWWNMFAKDGVSGDQFATAAEDVIRTREYKSMPTYAEIIKSIHGTLDDKAQAQATKVLEQVRYVGSYGSPDFDDPVTAELMRTRWRWQSFCQTLEESKSPFFVKEFIEAYKSFTRQPENKLAIGSGQARDIRQLTQDIGK